MLDRVHQLAGKSILVIDDSQEMASLVTDVFRSCGARVTIADSGHAAMPMVRFGSYDLVVLDLVMSRSDGWDLLSFMRQAKPAMLRRTVILTADRYHRERMSRIRRAGCPVIFKPFDIDDLRTVAGEVIGRGDSHSAA